MQAAYNSSNSLKNKQALIHVGKNPIALEDVF